MPDRAAVLLGFDGIVCGSDLPVQAFARHCAQALPVDRGRALIGGMRGFLEDKPDLLPPGVDLGAAEDGFAAVEMLAAAAGLQAATIGDARRRARGDLAASAWAVEPAEGLVELLNAVGDVARVWVTTIEATGVREVLEATELDGRLTGGVLHTDTSGPNASGPNASGTATRAMVDEIGDPRRVLALATRWTDLAPAADSGCPTALVDRFRRGLGEPTWRAGTLADLIPPIRAWAHRIRAGEAVA